MSKGKPDKVDYMKQADEAKELLTEFASDIEAAFGVAERSDGLCAPIGDEDWIDLGELYVKVCDFLGRKPMIEEYENEEE